MQIKITLTEENYNRLKDLADTNYRTISQEVNYRLNQLLSRPGGPDAPNPLYYPPGVRGIPDLPQFIPHNTPGGIRTPIPENPNRGEYHNQYYYHLRI